MNRVWLIFLLLFGSRGFAAQGTVNFSRQIRPILSENCFTCHGPDEGQRKAKLRLDTKEGAFEIKDGKPVIKPGDSKGSELIRRITATDPDDHMPPPKSGKKLTDAQIDLIKQWIDQGADWEKHWAFQKPVRPPLPEVKDKSWPKNEIDYFVLNKLEKEGLSPSSPAPKAVLARRATLDLTGLPPSIDELDAYLADKSDNSYGKLVDRLLDSSRYGEQMGRYWLDSARYADSHGYHIDAPRSIWKYRDWVIDAFNHNKPFDQFTIEQVAGDLLPNATLDQQVASGFNRCNMSTGEGGAIEAEYRVRYASDRVQTVSTVFLGLTMGCAQCHSHKYDPISQKEFYEMSAFFNSIAEPALDGNQPAPPPAIKVPTKKQAAQLARLDEKISQLKQKLDAPDPKLDAAQAEWEKNWRERLRTEFHPIAPVEAKSTGGADLKIQSDASVLASGKNPDKDSYEMTFRVPPGPIGALRLEALTDDSLPNKGAARSDNGNFVLSEIDLLAAPIAEPSRREKIKLISATADYSQDTFPVANAIDGKKNTGWAVAGYEKRENRTAIFIPDAPFGFPGGTEVRARLGFETRFAKHAIGRFRISVANASEGLRLLTPLALSPWQAAGPFKADSGEAAFKTAFGPEKRIDLTETFLDGKVKWTARPDFTDGKVNELSGDNTATYLYRVIRSPSEQKVTLSFGSDDGIKAWLNGAVILEKNLQRGVAADQDKVTATLKPGRNELLLKVVNYTGGYAFYFNALRDPAESLTPEIAQTLAFASGPFTDQQKTALRKFYRENFSPGWKAISAEVVQTEAQRKKVDSQVVVTMVSKDLDTPRDTYLLIRGQYDQHGEKVFPGTPAILPPLPHGAKTNRLTLAKWIVSKDNPLTARVTVNRFWQHYFGTGLVKTAEDFGSQGEPPSNQPLLDWLAVEFMESGWDVKHIQKLIVTSATYRQSSRVTPELLQRDPENRLLARGPRFRMDAEMLRDTALDLGGLLVEKIGGPSVKPYQPAGLWTEVSYGFKEDYMPDKGQGLYRRSMYTYWKRQSPPPSMTTFDAPSREVCTVRRQRTDTPLQALVLMDDPQFVEASRAFAARAMKRCSDPDRRIEWVYRAATARHPSQREVQILRGFYEKELARFHQDNGAAEKLLSVGETPLDPALDPAQWAAWTTVTSMVLNLDATVTKG